MLRQARQVAASPDQQRDPIEQAGPPRLGKTPGREIAHVARDDTDA